LLANAEQPVIVADRVARTPAGTSSWSSSPNSASAGHRPRRPDEHAERIASITPREARLQRHVIIGFEVADYWALVNDFVDNGLDGIGINGPHRQAPTDRHN
jgi:hypothetical protein